MTITVRAYLVKTVFRLRILHLQVSEDRLLKSFLYLDRFHQGNCLQLYIPTT